MARKQEKDAATQVVLQLVAEAEELKKQEEELKKIAANKYHPPPELIQVEAMVN